MLQLKFLPAVWYDAPCESSRPTGLKGWEWTALALDFVGLSGHATPHVLDLSLVALLSVEHVPDSGSPCEGAPWAVAQESLRKISDDLTFASALHRNLGVSKSSLMFTVSK